MFKNEVNYRIAKVILTNIRHFEILDDKETELVCNKLLEYYSPEFKSAEDTTDIKGDGDLVSVNAKNCRKKIKVNNGDDNGKK